MRKAAYDVIVGVADRLRGRRNARPYSEFIPFKPTLNAAKAAGLSVSEYLERRHLSGQKYPLDQTMEGLAARGVFSDRIEAVCEIGPGSGRYLAKTIERCHPGRYEIYETAAEWRQWLVEEYGVIARKCDGRTLRETERNSVDLVHAHKVFGGGLPFLHSVFYFREMSRIVRDGGWVVFDVMTENCFSEQHLDSWFGANPWGWEWTPYIMPRDYVIGIFAKNGIHLTGSFCVPSFPGITECMVFRKPMPAVTSGAPR